MLGLDAVGAAPKVLLCAGATDMRKGFEGLRVLVERQMGANALSGQLFVFCNRRADRLKVLWWDGSGLWVCAKRLEKGSFSWPKAADAQQPVIHLSREQWVLLVGGLELARVQQKDWYRVP